MEILEKGSRGHAVGALHQALVECGYAIDGVELAAEYFGDSTRDAVMEFQSRGLDKRGRPLSIDGRVGDETRTALARMSVSPLRPYAPEGWHWDRERTRPELVRVIEWAVTMLGTVEDPPGSNRGHEIDYWTGYVGRAPDEKGPPWCAYFVSAAYAAFAGGTPMPRMGSTYKILEWAKAHGRLVEAAAAPAPGDVFCILRTRYSGHAGLVVADLGDGRVYTLEGNTANAVRGLVRERATFEGLVRPVP